MSPTSASPSGFSTAKKRRHADEPVVHGAGVGLFIVTQATTSGFEEFFHQTSLARWRAAQIEDQMQDTLRSMNAGGGSDFLVSHGKA